MAVEKVTQEGVMNKVKVGFLGFGTVGKGAYDLLKNNRSIIRDRIDVEVEVTKIYVRRPEAYYDYTLMEGTELTSNIDDILEDESIQIIVEVMGGTEFAADCIKKALANEKNVVTANKDLVATAGPYLFDLAEKNGVDFRYEASVLGGIPIIRPLYDSLCGNQITELMGIMNGTTNFILSKMSEEGLGYDEVLKEAQELGYAEADPTADVGGLDAARKLAILSSIAFNQRVFFEDVSVEGITNITDTDIAQAEKMGYIIKLIGMAKETRKGLSLSVHPALLPKEHPLSSVRGAYNAIYVQGNGIGDAMFYGHGAGGAPTGSSIVSDVMEIARNVANNCTGRKFHFYRPVKVVYPAGKVQNSYYIRLRVDNKTGVLARIAGKFAENRISVRSVAQSAYDGDSAALIIITEPCPRAYVLNCIDGFNSLKTVRSVDNFMRVLN